MGRKIRAAKASLVAAFLAAGGTAAAKAVPAQAAPPQAAATAPSVNWGDPLIRFLKLDGFPAYLKIDGFAQLALYYKDALIGDASTMYWKYRDQVSGILDLYQKADAGPLSGILIGLEQWYKGDATAIQSFLKIESNFDAYIKFFDFFQTLQRVDGEQQSGALQFFLKETGLDYVPAVQELQKGGEIG